MYYSHTMYPGGLKERKYKDVIKKKPEDVCIAILYSNDTYSLLCADY